MSAPKIHNFSDLNSNFVAGVRQLFEHLLSAGYVKRHEKVVGGSGLSCGAWFNLICQTCDDLLKTARKVKIDAAKFRALEAYQVPLNRCMLEVPYFTQPGIRFTEVHLRAQYDTLVAFKFDAPHEHRKYPEYEEALKGLNSLMATKKAGHLPHVRIAECRVARVRAVGRYKIVLALGVAENTLGFQRAHERAREAAMNMFEYDVLPDTRGTKEYLEERAHLLSEIERQRQENARYIGLAEPASRALRAAGLVALLS